MTPLDLHPIQQERNVLGLVLWRKGSYGSDAERGSLCVERFLTVRAALRVQGT